MVVASATSTTPGIQIVNGKMRSYCESAVSSVQQLPDTSYKGVISMRILFKTFSFKIPYFNFDQKIR